MQRQMSWTGSKFIFVNGQPEQVKEKSTIYYSSRDKHVRLIIIIIYAYLFILFDTQHQYDPLW